MLNCHARNKQRTHPCAGKLSIYVVCGMHLTQTRTEHNAHLRNVMRLAGCPCPFSHESLDAAGHDTNETNKRKKMEETGMDQTSCNAMATMKEKDDDNDGGGCAEKLI